ncbi:ABC transporter permease [Nocardia uniformis]|uniref:ABC transporter permease n=1 Tax=Nocardia uniformis TaxID=53432 RepID=A0A849C533_9NOCA|nr:ABC transporter permease [Nocardia uniformis]NNH70917.1 ABC transporter permease [Nocardia uniformis]
MASRYAPPLLRPLLATGQVLARPVKIFVALGHQALFVLKVLAAIPFTLTNYWRQVLLMVSDIAWGNGALVVGGGTATVLIGMGFGFGAATGIVGFMLLDSVGMGPLTGFLSSYANTRELAPLIAAIGFAAQAGCRMTAEIGSMRISEEIDALESIAVRPLPFVVGTRVVAGFITIVPLYLLTLLISYLSSALIITVLHGAASGTYDHYFTTYVAPMDVLYSLVKAIIFVVAIILFHSYQGYYAEGGPEGVGKASGRAIRASLVGVIVLDMILTPLLWGSDAGIKITG